MLDSLERAISMKTLILALPVISLINQIEWLLTRRRFNRAMHADLENAREAALRNLPPEVLDRIKEKRPEPIKPRPAFRSSDKLTTALGVTGSIAMNTAISYSAARELKPGIPLFLFTTSLSTHCVGLPGSLAFAILARRYVPGLLTSAGVTLPYALYVFYRLYHGRFVTRRALFWSLGIGALLMLPPTLIGISFGWLLARARSHHAPTPGGSEANE